MEHHRRHHRHLPRRSLFSRNFKIFIGILLVSLLTGIFAVLISAMLTSAPWSAPMGITEEKKEAVVNNYKDNFGSEWKKKLLEDYKTYTGK